MEDERTQRIRETAYRLWEQAGRPAGGADEFWYEAERLVAEGREPPGLGEEGAGFAGREAEPDPGGAPEPSAPSSTGRPPRRRMTRSEP
jgi:hypothetical protein